jgi:hypothetical protein
MKDPEYVGGPLCGRKVEHSMVDQDWLTFKIQHSGGTVIEYTYVYDDETNNFEFIGFLEEDDD